MCIPEARSGWHPSADRVLCECHFPRLFCVFCAFFPYVFLIYDWWCMISDSRSNGGKALNSRIWQEPRTSKDFTSDKTKKLYTYIAKKCKKSEKNNLMVWRYENDLYICPCRLPRWHEVFSKKNACSWASAIHHIKYAREHTFFSKTLYASGF